jgi:two-component system, chemotaxis family, chemotaxis protein CheY
VKKKILIVDDSAMSRRMMRRIVESADFEVIEAEEGPEALEKYYLDKPDVVFLDLTMRDMYGLEVLEKLRQLDPDAKVIVASADIQDMTRDSVAEAGADGFINKPLTSEKVLGVLNEVIGKDGAE